VRARISTRTYERHHGRKPRGFGLWIFQINNLHIESQAMYAKAKERAIIAARAKLHPLTPIQGEVLP
jgi:hypothetical protein